MTLIKTSTNHIEKSYKEIRPFRKVMFLKVEVERESENTVSGGGHVILKETRATYDGSVQAVQVAEVIQASVLHPITYERINVTGVIFNGKLLVEIGGKFFPYTSYKRL